MSGAVRRGHGERLGAWVEDGGVNFAVFSAHASRIEVCLFDSAGEHEQRRVALPERTGDIWHGFVPELGAGTRYALRAHGPWEPDAGHRFNPAKLLIDPYARALTGPVRFDPLQRGHLGDDSGSTARPDPRDSAAVVPRSIVLPETPPVNRSASRSSTGDLIWELHPRGVSMLREEVPRTLRGTFDALGQPWLIEHLLRLGVTTVELMPVQAFMDEAALVARGLRNYWGYNPINFFTPEARYLGPAGADGFRTMVSRFHDAGIQVLLDVVYNHTAESDADGPTLSWRGLDNASYYLLGADDASGYVNWTGCGNTLAVHRPAVLRQVLDSLRHWVQHYGVDGFRFDLATTLAREPHGFDPQGGFLDALGQDPVLARTRLIAEPWDVGPDGYRPGAFPAEFAEWNDHFRDAARGFWRGDRGMAPDLAHALLGSARRFDRPGHAPARAINYLAAHDGFTLADATSYTRRRNEANGEGNRDGHSHNLGDGCGAEGPSDDSGVREARALRRRSLLATLFLAQGTPMLYAGDEGGNSQHGNNNAYCQDNPTGWLDWPAIDGNLVAFTARLAAFRRAHPVLRQTRFLHGDMRADGRPDIVWLALDGGDPRWDDPALRSLALVLRTHRDEGEDDDTVLIAVNASRAPAVLKLPSAPGAWVLELDSSQPELDHGPAPVSMITVAAGALIALVPEEAA